MALIKCVGCYDLLREEIELYGRFRTTADLSFGQTRLTPSGGKHLVVYNCPRYFPYACALSGLLSPGSGIVEAIKDCPEHLGDHCILCAKTDLVTLGHQIVFICREHDKAWGKWLKEHSERRAYLAPKGRVRQSNWIEVFREFIEDMRSERKS